MNLNFRVKSKESGFNNNNDQIKYIYIYNILNKYIY